MALLPLTHHEILQIVAPFSARGRHVDLAASDRPGRCIAFRPLEHAAQSPDAAALRETMRLECFATGGYRLTRVLHEPFAGLEASLSIEGSDLAALLARVDAVDPFTQFQRGAGFIIGLSYHLEPVRGEMRQVLTLGEARIDGLTLILRPSGVGGTPADLELNAPAGDELELPEDLLAVLGWAWRRLVKKEDGWRSLLRLDRREPARSFDAERKLRLAAGHLASTLAESPLNFHERLLRARWGVTFRRALPLLVGLGLIVAAALVPYLPLANDSPLHMMIFHVPGLLLVLYFCLPETPTIEIPPLPRRPAAASWRIAPAAANAQGTS